MNIAMKDAFKIVIQISPYNGMNIWRYEYWNDWDDAQYAIAPQIGTWEKERQGNAYNQA